jgi:hypothetical protein
MPEIPEIGIASSASIVSALPLEEGMKTLHHRPGVGKVYRVRDRAQKAQELSIEDGAGMFIRLVDAKVFGVVHDDLLTGGQFKQATVIQIREVASVLASDESRCPVGLLVEALHEPSRNRTIVPQ